MNHVTGSDDPVASGELMNGSAAHLTQFGKWVTFTFDIDLFALVGVLLNFILWHRLENCCKPL